MRTCETDGCDRPHKAKGLCRGCYQKKRKADAGPCVIEGCINPGGSGGGMCITHYGRRWKGKDMSAPVVPHIKKEDRYNSAGERLCTRCREFLPEGRFRNTGTKYGLAVYCNTCTKLYSYGINRVQYNRMFEDQGRACASCRATDPGWDRDWHIDHDHNCCPDPGKSCGKCVRAITCGPCNIILGYAKDDVDHLLALVDYLRKHK